MLRPPDFPSQEGALYLGHPCLILVTQQGGYCLGQSPAPSLAGPSIKVPSTQQSRGPAAPSNQQPPGPTPTWPSSPLALQPAHPSTPGPTPNLAVQPPHPSSPLAPHPPGPSSTTEATFAVGSHLCPHFTARAIEVLCWMKVT